MICNQQLPDYSHDMSLKGFSPYEILEAKRRTNRKKYQKQREEFILEKEMFNFIEGMSTAAVNKALDKIFRDFK